MMVQGSTTGSTIPSEDSASNGWDSLLRAIALGLVAVLPILSLIGLLGVRTGVASSSSNGYTLEVNHARITRPGLPTPFQVTISNSRGLPSEVTVHIDASYLTMFDENGLEPEPMESFNTTPSTSWTFAVPEGENELKVTFDARLEPAVQWGRSGHVTVEVEGRVVTAVDFHTWVLP